MARSRFHTATPRGARRARIPGTPVVRHRRQDVRRRRGGPGLAHAGRYRPADALRRPDTSRRQIRPPQGTVLASPAFERIAHPSVDAEGRRTPALRFGDPRVMALAGALCQTLLAATGFTNKNLRVLIAGLLGSDYTPGQMTYDLRRLRLNGLIRRIPHTNRYVLTADGIRIAVFYIK